MVVLGSFMIHVIADGIIYSFGLFYYEIAKHFAGGKAASSMVVSLMNGMTYFIGPIASALTIKFGCRLVTIAGAICTSVGFFLSVFAPNVYTLYFTIGICGGFGFGLMYLPAIVIVTSYFEKRRAFATGIAVCGSGIGTAIMSSLIEYLIDEMGWKGAMLVVAGVMLLCCLFGILFRPLPPIVETTPEYSSTSGIEGKETNEKTEFNLTIVPSIIEEEEDADESVGAMSQSAPRLSMPHEKEIRFPKSNCKPAKSMCSVQLYLNDPTNEAKQRSHSFSPGFLYRRDAFYSGSLVNIPNYSSDEEMYQKRNQKKSKANCCLFRWLNCSEEMMDNFSEMIDLSLLSNHIFLIFSISQFLCSVGFHIPFIYLKDRIVELKVASPQETGFFTAIIGISSTISRLVFGYLADHSFVNRLYLYMFSVTLCGFVIMSMSFASTYELMIAFCVLFGVTCGTYVSLTSVVLVDLLGLEKLTNAFGLILLFQGVASFVGPPFIGFIYDIYGVYDVGFYIIGAIVAFSGVMLVLIDLSFLSHYFRKLIFPKA